MKISYKLFAGAIKNINIKNHYTKKYNNTFKIEILKTSIEFTFFCNYNKDAEIHEIEYHPQTIISFTIPIEDGEIDNFYGVFECDNLNGFIGAFNEKFEDIEYLKLNYNTDKKRIEFIDTDRNICETIAHINGSGFDNSQFNITKELRNNVFHWKDLLGEYNSIQISDKSLKQIKKSGWNVMKDSELCMNSTDVADKYTFIIENSTLHVLTTNNISINHIKYNIDKDNIPFAGFTLKYQLFDIISKASSLNISFYNERVIELNFKINDTKFNITSYCNEKDLFVKVDDKWKSVYDIVEDYKKIYIKKLNFHLIKRLTDLEDLYTLNIPIDTLKQIVSDIKDIYPKELLKFKNRYDGHSDIPKVELMEDKDSLVINYQIDKVSRTLSGYIDCETLKTIKYNIPVKIYGKIRFIVNYAFKLLEYLTSYNKDVTFTYSNNSKYYRDKECNQYVKPIVIKSVDDVNEFILAPCITAKPKENP